LRAVRFSFWRAERQIRPPEREPNRPLYMRHLSEFSAEPENSHGASGVQDRTPKYRCRPGPYPASSPIPAVANDISATPNTNGCNATSNEKVVATLTFGSRIKRFRRLYPAACAVRLVGRGLCTSILMAVFPARRALRRRTAGWGSGLAPAPVSAFPGAGARPEPQPCDLSRMNASRQRESATRQKRSD